MPEEKSLEDVLGELAQAYEHRIDEVQERKTKRRKLPFLTGFALLALGTIAAFGAFYYFKGYQRDESYRPAVVASEPAPSYKAEETATVPPPIPEPISIPEPVPETKPAIIPEIDIANPFYKQRVRDDYIDLQWRITNDAEVEGYIVGLNESDPTTRITENNRKFIFDKPGKQTITVTPIGKDGSLGKKATTEVDYLPNQAPGLHASLDIPQIEEGEAAQLIAEASDPDDDKFKVEYNIDGGAWKPADNKTISGLPVGKHTIYAKATDKFGLESKVESLSLEVLPRIPAIDWLEAPQGRVRENSVSVSWKITNGASVGKYLVAFNDSAEREVTGEETSLTFDEGKQKIYITPVGIDGRKGETITRDFFYMPNKAPEVVVSLNKSFLTQGVDELSIEANAIDYDGDKITALEARVDRGSWKSISFGTNKSVFTGVDVGKHTLEAKATDEHGLSSEVWSGNFEVVPKPNRQPQVIASMGSKDLAWGKDTLRITLQASDPDNDAVSILYKFDDGKWKSYDPVNKIQARFSLGKHIAYAKAVDSKGLESTIWSDNFEVTDKSASSASSYPTLNTIKEAFLVMPRKIAGIVSGALPSSSAPAQPSPAPKQTQSPESLALEAKINEYNKQYDHIWGETNPNQAYWRNKYGTTYSIVDDQEISREINALQQKILSEPNSEKFQPILDSIKKFEYFNLSVKSNKKGNKKIITEFYIYNPYSGRKTPDARRPHLIGKDLGLMYGGDYRDRYLQDYNPK